MANEVEIRVRVKDAGAIAEGRRIGKRLEVEGHNTGRGYARNLSAGMSAGLGPVRGMLRSFGGAAIGFIAGAGLVAAIKGFTDEAREAAKIGRQTSAVIKATGGVANVTAGDVDRLAGSLMRKVAVDDDVIASGENIMLTFKGVRNEIGAGNNIFDQATVAAVDMTAAMNGGAVTQEGLQASSIRLGKALNDPLKGMTALQKVGVTFTQGQKDQIAAMVAAGDTMGAQKIILAELKSEFGGAAAAAVDPWQKVGVTLGEVKEQIGTALLPMLGRVATWLNDSLPTAVGKAKAVLKTLQTWWDNNKVAVQGLVTLLSDIFIPTADQANSETKDFADTLRDLHNRLSDVAIFVYKLIQAWLALEHVTIGVISIYGSLTIAAGHAINAIDRLSGGTGHAGDQFVTFGKQIKETARKELREVKEEARRAQEAIDDLKGKKIDINAQTGLQFTKTFTAEDWSKARQAAGRMATGGLVGGPPGRDKTPIWATRGEAVVPTHLVPEVAPFLAANGVPGFRAGGIVGGVTGTGQAHTGVANIMGNWTGKTMAALVNSIMSSGIGGGGGNFGSGSWKRAISELIRDHVAYQIISTFRRGAVTHASGRRSYHARNRAVDLVGPSKMAIFNSLSDTGPTELIYAGAPYYIAGGRRKPIGALDRVTYRDHIGHVHAAYEQGTNYVPHDGPAYLHKGEAVVPANQNRGGGIVLEVHPGGSEIDALFLAWLRKAVRVRGGNVQAALGS